MENIRENIKILQCKKDELEGIKTEIDSRKTKFEKIVNDARIKFEETLEPLKGRSDKLTEEYNLLAKNEICVSLGELINELSILTGIDVLDMGIKVKTDVGYWGKRNLWMIESAMDSSDQHKSCTGVYDKKHGLYITLYADENLKPHAKEQKFCYDLYYKLDLDAVQADGKRLIKHCSTEINYDDMQGLYYTYLIVNKNIKDLICKFSLSNLISKEKKEGTFYWYPVDLLTQAVINCIERQNEQQHEQRETNSSKRLFKK